MERGGDDAGEGFRLIAALDELLCRTHEAVFRAELAHGAAGDACHGIGEMRVAEAAFRRLDVRFMRCLVKTVFLFEQRARLFPDGARRFDERVVLHGRVDIFVALLIGEVRDGGMACVDREELALDVGRQVVNPREALDLRAAALGLRGVRIPLAVRLDLDEQLLVVLLDRDDAVDSGIREADELVDFRFRLFGQRFVDEILQHGRAADHVLAGDDVERLRVLLEAAHEAFRDVRRDEFQDVRADGRRDDVRAGDGFEQVFEIRRAVDGAHAFDVDALGLVADDLDVVST